MHQEIQNLQSNQIQTGHVIDDASWLTLNPTSGNNNQILTATYTENTTTSQRVGTITVIGGGITKNSNSNTISYSIYINCNSTKSVSNKCIRKYRIYSGIKYKLDSE